MTRICWWLVDILSRMLEPGERDAVRGDFAESGESGGRALRDLLGLVARRQAALWKVWQPWLVLLGLIVPLGMLLSIVSRGTADQNATYVWLYANNWDWALLKDAAFWREFAGSATLVSARCLTLVCWSWTAGFVLGSMSRRIVAVYGVLFCLMLAFGGLWGAPRYFAYFSHYMPRPLHQNDLVFALAFYRVLFPLIVQAALVAAPSLWGMCQGAGARRTPAPLRIVLWSAAIGALTLLVVQEPGFVFFLKAYWLQGIWQSWQIRWLQLVVYWPVGYLAARTTWRRWPRKTGWLLCAALVGWGSSAAAQSSFQDYTQWRGQNRDGSASAFSQPKVWPEKLMRRWKLDVGEGYATPLVVGGTVHSFTRRNGNEVMMALNAADGKIVWQTSYAAPYKMADPTKAHGRGPRATPLYHHGKLYTLGVSGIASAFDALSGKLVWQKPAPAEQPFFGAASSPVADNDLVIFHPGNYDPLTAFDANTGDVKWRAKGDGMYASPMVVELEGIRQVVSMGQQNIEGVRVADGSILWQYPWAGEDGGMQAITPILYGGTIIVGSYHAGVTALRPARHDGKWVVDVVWETKDISLFLSNPVLIGGTLFGLSEKASGQFFALDAKSGKVLWLGKSRQATNTAVVKAGDLLFLLNDNAELIVAKSSLTGFEPLKRYIVADSATWAQPAISGNRIFVKDVSSLALWTLN